MKVLYIEGNRTGYGPDQCGRTMTVGELIELLGEFEEDTPVYLRNGNGNGYIYGHVREEDITEGDTEEEEE